ncbi:sporulation integral membrane protein YlbJ [Alicyclobacillus dauci]|uniref:Sporulation integral membrane protein YlbJ n=1 Tax=Alicyclobacillus dauci TaxID=1475485 RepID=A0ABY6YXM3_9BACL|nr:sporulation integral membrane protein YlbJ [Alicyclobacillus dauci]WAH35137.1 sporulation integral membrane protein YlbJ [Alicyclobacillus dauci]
MSRGKKSHLSTLLLAVMAIIFTIALVVYPKQAFEAGMSGLKVCWEVIIPSLLPFFVLSEILLGLGVVRGFGVLLEPLMRPLFSVPGVGAFALSMGLAAGYPMDAVITARFRETNQCTRIEGERLLAFTNTADPLFMFGAVAVGMLKSPAVGGLLAVAHYISSFLVGVLFKFWGRNDKTHLAELQARNNVRPRGNLIKRAFQETLRARDEDGRPFGKLLGNSVTESIQTILMICGFIVFFAVLIEILHISGIMAIVAWPIALVYHLFHINGGLVNPTLAGILELDIGSAQAAAAGSAPMLQKLALISGIIAWSGLSVHAQVASVLTQTDIRMKPYFLARFLHAVLAAALTVVLWFLGMGQTAAQAFAHVTSFTAVGAASTGHSFWHVTKYGFSFWIIAICAMLGASVIFGMFRRVRIISFHARIK